MISTRRIVAAVGLAASVTGLASLPASAAPGAAPVAGPLKPLGVLDSLAAQSIPAPQRAQVPTVAGQLSGLDHLRDLNRLNQLTDPVAPVLGMVPAVQH
ncbi:hypothetical protein [Streptomyces tropicalis]|uniref:Secreted protein n=1 Tax=Streptomyces tropicalis TaxID=3034234 RepID=A0ABT6A2W6_9ACTN|nr:hypothetical protein [Streptomyces tropicalis]MDF3298995.1 hypothetical protein [Streptomyces tropicalis]